MLKAPTTTSKARTSKAPRLLIVTGIHPMLGDHILDTSYMFGRRSLTPFWKALYLVHGAWGNLINVFCHDGWYLGTCSVRAYVLALTLENCTGTMNKQNILFAVLPHKINKFLLIITHLRLLVQIPYLGIF